VADETAEARIMRRIEEACEAAADADDQDAGRSPDTVALGVVLAEELRILRSENLKEMGRMLDVATARLREEMHRATGCQRCNASGKITARHGQFDECPDCRGAGR